MGVAIDQEAFVGLFAGSRGKLSWKSDPVLITGKAGNDHGVCGRGGVGHAYRPTIDGRNKPRASPSRQRPHGAAGGMLLCHQQSPREHPDDTRRESVLTVHLCAGAPSLKGKFCRSPFEEQRWRSCAESSLQKCRPFRAGPAWGRRARPLKR